jgi:hypothetical protein
MPAMRRGDLEGSLDPGPWGSGSGPSLLAGPAAEPAAECILKTLETEDATTKNAKIAKKNSYQEVFIRCRLRGLRDLRGCIGRS